MSKRQVDEARLRYRRERLATDTPRIYTTVHGSNGETLGFMNLHQPGPRRFGHIEFVAFADGPTPETRYERVYGRVPNDA